MSNLQDYEVIFSVEQSGDGQALVTALVTEIPGLMAEGATEGEARDNLEKIFPGLIASLEADRIPIPPASKPLPVKVERVRFMATGDLVNRLLPQSDLQTA